MNTEQQAETPLKPLPIRSFLIVLVIILSVVSILAAIAGENSKLKTQAARFVMCGISGDYEQAESLLTESARNNIPREKLYSKLAALKLYLIDQYGVGLEEEYKVRAESDRWIPWIGDKRKLINIGLYKSGSGTKGMIKEYLSPPPFEGEQLKNLLTLEREKGRWKIAQLNFDETDLLAEISHVQGKHHITLTEDGFILQGISFSRKYKLDEKELMEMRKALYAAIRELERGNKPKPDDGLMNMFK